MNDFEVSIAAMCSNERKSFFLTSSIYSSNTWKEFLWNGMEWSGWLISSECSCRLARSGAVVLVD